MPPSPAIRFVVTIQVHDIAGFTDAATRCVAISRDEPGTLHYDWFLNEETGAARLVEAYASVGAVLAHAQGPVFTDVGPTLLETCTFVSMDAFGDTGKLGDGAQFWPSTYWGTPFAELAPPAG
jgi:quinol monooxygenase YgiN